MMIYQDETYEIRVKKDRYGRDTDVQILSPIWDFVQKRKVIYDDKGDLSVVRYDFISNQNETAQIRRYLFDENHLPMVIDVCHMEAGTVVHKETITFHKTYAPDGSLSRIVKQHGKHTSALRFTDIQ